MFTAHEVSLHRFCQMCPVEGSMDMMLWSFWLFWLTTGSMRCVVCACILTNWHLSSMEKPFTQQVGVGNMTYISYMWLNGYCRCIQRSVVLSSNVFFCSETEISVCIGGLRTVQTEGCNKSRSILMEDTQVCPLQVFSLQGRECLTLTSREP